MYFTERPVIYMKTVYLEQIDSTNNYAGKLIEDAGLKGYRIGGAMVSEKHCGFVINAGNATSMDVIKVIMDVQKKVFDRFHVRLEPEICFLGWK